jgi:hypothetical protein
MSNITVRNEMSWLDNLGPLDEPQEIAHDFEIDLNCVVVANHNLTLEAIDRDEDEELAKIEQASILEDYEIARSITGTLQNFYDDLRLAARRLAVVGLVTRFQHWIIRFVQRRKLGLEKSEKPKLVKQLNALDKDLGMGPVCVEFFENLVGVRDSVIHGDSRAEWEHNGRVRKVAEEYRNPYGDVEITEEQLKEAIEKAIQQVKWYEERLSAASAGAQKLSGKP